MRIFQLVGELRHHVNAYGVVLYPKLIESESGNIFNFYTTLNQIIKDALGEWKAQVN